MAGEDVMTSFHMTKQPREGVQVGPLPAPSRCVKPARQIRIPPDTSDIICDIELWRWF